MKIRADVAELLHAGLSDREIATRLHTCAKSVAAARTKLGLPKAKSGPKPAAVTDLIAARSERVEGGHLRWTGYAQGDRPAVRHDGRLLSVWRIQFRAVYGREPVGYVRPSCDYPGCVEGAHLDDRLIRERNRAAYAAIFGEVAR